MQQYTMSTQYTHLSSGKATYKFLQNNLSAKCGKSPPKLTTWSTISVFFTCFGALSSKNTEDINCAVMLIFILIGYYILQQVYTSRKLKEIYLRTPVYDHSVITCTYTYQWKISKADPGPGRWVHAPLFETLLRFVF